MLEFLSLGANRSSPALADLHGLHFFPEVS